MYKIGFNEQTRVLEICTEGFWDVETAKRFGNELSATLKQLRAKYGAVATFSDGRKLPVQSAEVTAILGEMTGQELMFSTARVAMLTSGALSTLQAKRIGSHDNIRMFNDEDAAWEWLRGDPSTRL